MSDPGDVTGKWNYGTTPQFAYGEDTTYRRAMEFLDGPYIIEDWGCGAAWARKFVQRGRYIGIDGSWSMHCDKVVDLRMYRSTADAILMRHVLEHNYDWERILENALASFQKKVALVMFTPFSSGETKSIGSNPEGTIPDLSFKKQDLLDLIGKFPYTEESVPSATQYGFEHVFYIARSAGDLPKTSTPAVSVIIPTAFAKLDELLKPCLESMIRYTDLGGMEVIVVANGCPDGTDEYVRKLGPPFRLVSFPDALGFTKATNEGIKVARGRHLILLNNDILFLEQPRGQWLEQLLAPFKGNSKMGITGPLQFHDYYSGEDLIVGACLCISREALQDAGGQLDEIFSPGGGEDVDLCCKVRRAGYVVRQIPKEGEPGKHWANVDGTFMLFHKNNQTFNGVPDYWEKTVKRNGLVNMKRYNRDIRLCLGARGEEPWTYAQVDVAPTGALRSPLIMDIRALDFEDRTVSEILSVDPQEYLERHELMPHGLTTTLHDLFTEWRRVLKPDGKLVVEFPAVDTSMRSHLEMAGFGRVVSAPALYPPVRPGGNMRLEATK